MGWPDLDQLQKIGSLLALVGIPVWIQFGKSRDSNFIHIVSERDRLEKKVAEMDARLERVEADLEALRADHRTLLDFLRDITSGYFPDLAAVARRAGELLARMGGHHETHG